MYCNIARFTNLPFASVEFWELKESQLFPYVVAAYREHEKKIQEEKNETHRVLYWLGSMLNQLATGVINAFGGKLTTSLGEMYRKSIWEGEKPTKSKEGKYIIHPWEFEQFRRPSSEESEQ